MSSNSLILQISFVIMAAFIGGMYVYPTFLEIQGAGRTLEQYDNAIEQVNSVNTVLNELTTIVEDISLADVTTINRFVSEQVDTVQITRDLAALLEGREVDGLQVQVTSNAQSQNVTAQAATGLNVQPFEIAIDFTAPYQTVKQVFVDLETNDYPIDITAFTVTQAENEVADDDGVIQSVEELLSVTISAQTYQAQYGTAQAAVN